MKQYEVVVRYENSRSDKFPAKDPPETPLIEGDPGVLANDTDAENNTLTAVLVSSPANGSLTLNANGSFTYTPNAGFIGKDSFTYGASDGSLTSTVATVEITVNAVNHAPTVAVAAGGLCATNDRSGTVKLTVSDPDTPNEAPGDLTASSSNQTLVPNTNLTFGGTGASRTLTATVVSGKAGAATITVTVSDGNLTGTVTLTLRAGGNSNNTLTGTNATNILLGQNGDDTLSGLGGNDLLCAARGNDKLSGGDDADRFDGGSGNDRATDFSASQGDTRVGIP